jgi:arylsulfatase A-like enzyme
MTRPNVVFIMADDMGYGDFGCFSEDRVQTPTLDHLVREGVCLGQHYAAAPVCTPSRAAFLTGRYPHRTGAIDMRESRGLDRISLRERTIADQFTAAGYSTGLVGKWHSGSIGAEYHPNQRGFREFVGFRHGLMSYYDWRIEKNGQKIKPDGTYLTDYFTNEACDFIHRNRSDPFFLYVAYNAPHTPLEVPADELKPYLESGRYSEKVSKIYAMITRMDRGINRILEQLKKEGILDNTIVVFTSDNGPALYSGMDRFNAGLREGKTRVYEGGVKVPMIIRWSHGLEQGTEHHGLVHSCDLLPTLTTACGIDLKETLPLDGIDQWNAIQNHKSVTKQPLRFWQWNRYQPEIKCNAAVRDGEWKLVRPAIAVAMKTSPEEMEIDRLLIKNPESFDSHWITAPFPERKMPEVTPKTELYNLCTDPGEQSDIAESHPEISRRLLRELENWFEEVERERIAAGQVAICPT